MNGIIYQHEITKTTLQRTEKNGCFSLRFVQDSKELDKRYVKNPRFMHQISHFERRNFFVIC